MGNMDVFFDAMPIIFGGIFILAIAIFIFVAIQMFSPKARGKMMSKQMEAMKHMTNFSKNDMQDVLTNLSEVSLNAKRNVITQNEEALRDIANKEASINKDAIKTTMGAIREGLSGEEKTVFCKHCGAIIDADSRFCKECGKEQ